MTADLGRSRTLRETKWGLTLTTVILLSVLLRQLDPALPFYQRFGLYIWIFSETVEGRGQAFSEVDLFDGSKVLNLSSEDAKCKLHTNLGTEHFGNKNNMQSISSDLPRVIQERAVADRKKVSVWLEPRICQFFKDDFLFWFALTWVSLEG